MTIPPEGSGPASGGCDGPPSWEPWSLPAARRSRQASWQLLAAAGLAVAMTSSRHAVQGLWLPGATANRRHCCRDLKETPLLESSSTHCSSSPTPSIAARPRRTNAAGSLLGSSFADVMAYSATTAAPLRRRYSTQALPSAPPPPKSSHFVELFPSNALTTVSSGALCPEAHTNPPRMRRGSWARASPSLAGMNLVPVRASCFGAAVPSFPPALPISPRARRHSSVPVCRPGSGPRGAAGPPASSSASARSRRWSACSCSAPMPLLRPCVSTAVRAKTTGSGASVRRGTREAKSDVYRRVTSVTESFEKAIA
mmetsp:Transcript_4245/g.10278  ORF Transcript_4245/g.10278 Transcript_4245/m.10278 type:complete len:312 (+) Transcript_4245:264-1199(+)